MELACAGAHVVLAWRDATAAADARLRLGTALPDVQVEVQVLDLADLSPIRNAAARLREAHDRIDVLVNDAGVMGPPTRLMIVDGFSCSSAPTTSATSRSPDCCCPPCCTPPPPAS